MTQRQTIIFGFARLVAVLASICFNVAETTETEPELRPLFANLERQVRAVTTLEIEGQDTAVTLRRTDGAWTVAERGDYPAARSKISDLLRGLVAAERLQRKTADPALLPEIGLGDEATTLVLRDEAGERVAALNVGVRQVGSVGQDSETFVRRPDEEASWTVSALPSVSADPVDWLAKDVFDLARTRVATLSIRHGDGETVTITRDAPDGDFRLAGLAEDETIKRMPGPEAPVTALTFINLKDVAPAGTKDFSDAPVVVELAAFDGLTVTAEIWPQDDAAWARLSAAYDPDRAAASDAPQAMPDAPADGAAEAQTLNRRWSGWIYALPAYKGDDLTLRRDDLVEPADETQDGEQ